MSPDRLRRTGGQQLCFSYKVDLPHIEPPPIDVSTLNVPASDENERDSGRLSVWKNRYGIGDYFPICESKLKGCCIVRDTERINQICPGELKPGKVYTVMGKQGEESWLCVGLFVNKPCCLPVLVQVYPLPKNEVKKGKKRRK